MARSKQSELKRKQSAVDGYKQVKSEVNKGDHGNLPDHASRRTKVFKKRRWKSSTVAKREIVKAQRSTKPLIPRTHVYKLMREFADGSIASRFEAEAVDTLREALTVVGVGIFDASNKVRQILGKEMTVNEKHMQIGRATMNIKCFSDTYVPMEKRMGIKKHEKKHFGGGSE